MVKGSWKTKRRGTVTRGNGTMVNQRGRERRPGEAVHLMKGISRTDSSRAKVYSLNSVNMNTMAPSRLAPLMARASLPTPTTSPMRAPSQMGSTMVTVSIHGVTPSTRACSREDASMGRASTAPMTALSSRGTGRMGSEQVKEL